MSKPVIALIVVGGGEVVELDCTRAVGGGGSNRLPVGGGQVGTGLHLVGQVCSPRAGQMEKAVGEISVKEFERRRAQDGGDVDQRFIPASIVLRIEKVANLIVRRVKQQRHVPAAGYIGHEAGGERQ